MYDVASEGMLLFLALRLLASRCEVNVTICLISMIIPEINVPKTEVEKTTNGPKYIHKYQHSRTE